MLIIVSEGIFDNKGLLSVIVLPLIFVITYTCSIGFVILYGVILTV